MSISDRITTILRESEEDVGRNFDTLKDTIGPHIGYEKYKEIISRERASGNPDANLGNDYQPPIHRVTKEPYGPKDNHGRVIPWSKDEVIEAMRRYIYKFANEFTSGPWQQAGFQADDAWTNGAYGVLEALEKDRADAPFVNFSTMYINRNIRMGLVDPHSRKARGILKDLEKLVSSKASAETIQTLMQTGTAPGLKARSKDLKPVSGKNYGEYTDILVNIFNDAIQSVSSGDPKAVTALKKTITSGLDEILEMERTGRIGGAKTSDLIRTSGATYATMQCRNCGKDLMVNSERFGRSGADSPKNVGKPRPTGKERPMRRDEVPNDFKCPNCGTTDRPIVKAGSGPIRTSDIGGKSSGGGEEGQMRSDLPSDKIGDPAEKASTNDAIKTLLDKTKLTDQERNLINMIYFQGIQKSEAAQMLGISAVRVSQVMTKALSKMKQTGDQLGLEAVDQVDLMIIREATLTIIKWMLNEVKKEKAAIIYS